jgi:hypothetical protein
LFEHENMLTTTDYIFSFLRLQAKGEYYIILEGHMFERMTQVASTPHESLDYRSPNQFAEVHQLQTLPYLVVF